MADNTEEIKKKMEELAEKAKTLGDSMTHRPGVDTRGSRPSIVAKSDAPVKPHEQCSRFDPKPFYDAVEGANVIDSPVNAQIVIGPHAPNGKFSRRFATGETGIGSIDLVAGRLGEYAKTVVLDRGAKTHDGGLKEEPVITDDNWRVDAARICIGAKGDPDHQAGVVPGKAGTSNGRSFVFIKADVTRIVGRESIKLVTGTDDKNSQGGKIDSIRGIDIIAGNLDAEIQPMIKGANLIECIDDINQNMADLNGILMDFMTQQMLFNSTLATHTHPYITAAGVPAVTIPSIEVMAAASTTTVQMAGTTFTSVMNNRLNITRNYFKYLNPKVGNCDKYVASKYNNVN